MKKNERKYSWFELVANRIFALILIILVIPIFIFVAFLIKIKMPDGPIFFNQKRIGREGVPFVLQKFRTMDMGHKGSSITVAGQSRITTLGRILRKYKLDELPQLWNILKGEMVFVGPRPDVEGYADQLVGEERKVLQLYPGITGPASLKYSNEEEILANQKDPIKYNDEVIYPDKVQINLEYYYNRNWWIDCKIIFQTMQSIFR